MKHAWVFVSIILLLALAKGCGAGVPFAASANGALAIGGGIGAATYDNEEEGDHYIIPPPAGTGTGTSTDTGSLTGTGTGTGINTDTGSHPGGTIGELFDAINSARTVEGYGVLKYDSALAAVAQARADWLAVGEYIYYSPVVGGTTPEQRLTDAGITFIMAGEAGTASFTASTWSDAYDILITDYGDWLTYPLFNEVGIGYTDFVTPPG
ncbi:MAG: spore germination YkwD domain-containing protein [Planctomycetota bacterium]|jgi:hypothetical protein